MAPQELQALEAFLTQLTQARAGAKDPQAQQLIAEAVARQPDAAYLLVQRAMLLDHALATAQAQVVSLQGQLAAAQANGAGNGSFISAQNAWGNSAAAMPAAPAPVPPQAVPAQPARTGFLGGGFGSTLGSIATTAAGVAGGALLFQGIENLFHHNSGSGFLGQSGSGMGPNDTTIVNNYFGNDDAALSGNRNTAMSDGFLDDGGLSGGLDDSGFADDDSSLV
ncbi:ABC transporter substrate-binding protein [Cupriavidus sp. UYMMa02A]|nr:ABC transporter substrate-binding protein [Cupriavidus sp. UYMMa02A]